MTDDMVTWFGQQIENQRHRAEALKTLACVLPAETGVYLTDTADLLLAEVDAKRRILQRHQPDEHFLHGTICKWCSVPQAGAYQSWPCPDIRDNATPYADRPGYRPEWRP